MTNYIKKIQKYSRKNKLLFGGIPPDTLPNTVPDTVPNAQPDTLPNAQPDTLPNAQPNTLPNTTSGAPQEYIIVTEDDEKYVMQNLLVIPLKTKRIPRVSTNIINFKTISSSDFDIDNDNFKNTGFGCTHHHLKSYKHCDILHQFIYKWFIVHLYWLLEKYETKTGAKDKLRESINIIPSGQKQNEKKPIEKLQNILSACFKLLGLTSFNPLERIMWIIEYVNRVIGRKIVQIKCPQNGKQIAYTCGRGSLLVDKDKDNGKDILVLSNSESKDHDYVAFDDIKQLNKELANGEANIKTLIERMKNFNPENSV
jgi:hypothetical protein